MQLLARAGMNERPWWRGSTTNVPVAPDGWVIVPRREVAPPKVPAV
ncbi:hypothetical protein [Tahibacter soli]|uniref:Uncharacterized protein n=1 Tax=Tahibacter soli TaxID=2983605 RepID=A0A9X4BKV5_9GAMM|nr:hypothetical protein [Tahibacter soli]MDC8014667.1 hypothetical protein [Tahibacter soli]